jgi:hypothetical protein
LSLKVILGSSGFLGSALKEEFTDSITVNRGNIDAILKEGIPEKDLIVINCISNAKSHSGASIHSDNYSVPLEIIKKLDISKWIQLSSYYSEFNNTNGVDFNTYSKSKDLFSSYLASNSRFQTLDLVLPHIYWPTEKRERFLSACYSASQENTEMMIASKNQVIPILSRVDVVHCIKNASISALEKNYTRFKVEAETIVYMKELEFVLTEITGSGPRLKDTLEPERRYFSEIDWPSKARTQPERIEALFKVFKLYATLKLN